MLVAGRWAWRGRGRRRNSLQCRIDPASLNPAIQAIGGLRIDAVGMQQKAAECRLDMATRAAEPVVKVEMAERGVEIVAPEQTDHPAPQPHAFGIARETCDLPFCFRKFINLLRLFGRLLAGGRGLVSGLGVGALSQSRGGQ